MDQLLDLILEPRLGHVLRPWPGPVSDAVRRLAIAAGQAEEEFLAELLRFPREDVIGQLVASATIPHTSFFRHPEQFDYLRASALKAMAARSGGVVRIWSAGCATGEEAYSIAMVADELDIETNILATDVSEECIAVAKRGRYDYRRAGVLPGAVPDRDWVAPESLRRRIRFEVASLTGGNPALGLQPFDIVFCRNVLIYFSAAAACELVDVLLRCVKRTGALVVAPVEGVLRVPRTRPVDAPLGWYGAEVVKRPPKPLTQFRPTTAPAARPPRPREPLEVAEHPLDVAARQLGAGDLGAAEELLWEALDKDPAQAEGWFLLGEALLLRGERSQARVAFNRAADCASGQVGAIDADTFSRAARRRAEMC